MWSLFFNTSHSVRVALLSAFFDKTIGCKHFHEIKYFQDYLVFSCLRILYLISAVHWLVTTDFQNKAALSIHYYLFKLDFKK